MRGPARSPAGGPRTSRHQAGPRPRPPTGWLDRPL